MSEKPLVSVIVLSYNSSATIIETLDSIKKQNYSNVELVIADDSSFDDSVNVCEIWLQTNHDRFESTKVIRNSENLGISANLNKAIKFTNGVWIKCIAADDVLLPNCIADNISYVEENPETKVLFSFVVPFKICKGKIRYLGVRPEESILPIFNMNAEKQLDRLYVECFPNAPSAFIHKSVYDVVSYDERFRNMEDYPFWINVVKRGYKLCFCNKMTVLYRYGESLSKSYIQFYNESFMASKLAFWESVATETAKRHPEVIRQRLIEKKVYEFTIKYLHNKVSFLNRACRYIIRKIYSCLC